MEKVSYKLEKNGDFIIEGYNRAKAFSSFFPGIAGLYGTPLWAFYVNRGQCVSSFGTKDKDGSILEFLPANQAYNFTQARGFRTFIKLKKGAKEIFYEPFRETASPSGRISEKMVINPYKLEIEEINLSLGIKINVSYITVPNESFAALARKVSITNISGSKIKLELLDGLPQITPFGMTEWHQKHMSRTVEAWMRVVNIENNAPFYNLKVNPQDTPELEYIKRGNFYAAYMAGGGRTKMLEPAIDPDIVFGRDGDISYPKNFIESKRPVITEPQRSEGKTPSAFAYAKFDLMPGRGADIVSVIGNASGLKEVASISGKIKSGPGYFDKKLSENRDIIRRLENNIFTKSSSAAFDFYAGQTYLDNLLRGGYPVNIGTDKDPFIFYAYARKHGDPERDYNSFLLETSYYSQGNGAYRDMNQNRRNDTLFNPSVGDENIMTFLNAIQPDGFNPHRIQGISVSVKNAVALKACLKKYIKSAPSRAKAAKFLNGDFTPGSLASFLEDEDIMPAEKAKKFLKDILALSAKNDVIKPGEGYWVDHWTYNIDLFENYLSCYPEKLEELLLKDRRFTFYDTYLKVNPRRAKYVYDNGKIRQYGSVVEDGAKRLAIDKRPRDRHKVRTSFGSGAVYKTSLLVKLICIVVNKMASIDPFGTGIEMEAGKPGWCDSLNGLPGVFGSSLCETFELKRLILFIKSSLGRIRVDDGRKIALPSELFDFLSDMEKLTAENIASGSKKKDFIYWDASWARKEKYRENVWPGFSGREKYISVKKLCEALDKFLSKVETGIRKGFDKKSGMTLTYYINEVKRFSFIREKGKRKLGENGLPLVRALSFSHRPVSLFLEGPVHAMRVMDKKQAASLYGAVKKSGIFDKKLKMYKINEPLEGMPDEIGRSTIFLPGWLENESIWLHMEYKYLLELLKKGLHEEFFSDLDNCLVAFHDPGRYGRNILENSSFIVSSAYPDKKLHGNGFVARLTGTTTEFLSIWLFMCLGGRPFRSGDDGKLLFQPEPVIPGRLFTKEDSVSHFYPASGGEKEIKLPKNIFAFCFAGKTLVVYHNPERRDTFGRGAALSRRLTLKKQGGKDVSFAGGKVPEPCARKIREGFYDRIDVNLG